MVLQSPKSLQSFFQPIPPPSQVPPRCDAPAPLMNTLSIGEASTEPKLTGNEVVDSNGHWQPPHDYEDVSIGELASGPRRVSFTARVVNLHDQTVQSIMSKPARGCLKVVVKDNSALMMVRLTKFSSLCWSSLTLVERFICGTQKRCTAFVWAIS